MFGLSVGWPKFPEWKYIIVYKVQETIMVNVKKLDIFKSMKTRYVVVILVIAHVDDFIKHVWRES